MLKYPFPEDKNKGFIFGELGGVRYQITFDEDVPMKVEIKLEATLGVAPDWNELINELVKTVAYAKPYQYP